MILQTKLHIPKHRSRLVSRPQLVERLGQALHKKLTLVCAPAGAGKTTLVVNWLAECEPATAWLSLDERDNELNRWLAYLIAALQTVQPEWGPGAANLLQGVPDVSGEMALASLINDVATADENVLLALDDYHLIKSARVHEALAFLVEHLPENLHLLILSRSEPPLPLARWRVKDELLELRAPDLRFSLEESAIFLGEVMGFELDHGQIEALEQRTEGWVAGLQMAGLSMQGWDDSEAFIAAFTGSHRYVLDYLTGEVLQQQAPEVQEFLLNTSILGQLCGPLCGAVSGRTDSQRMLEQLEAQNLFVVPLDEERRWYRYHHLFRELLLAHLQRERGASVPELHVRASAWYAGQGLVDEAIDHALLAGHQERAARLIQKQARETIMAGDPQQVVNWIGRLANHQPLDDPALLLAYVWALFLTGDMAGVWHYLPRTAASLQAIDAPARLWGELRTVEAMLRRYEGDMTGSFRLVEEALGCLDDDQHFVRGLLHLNLSGLHKDTGDIGRAVEHDEQAVHLLLEAGNMVAAATAMYFLVSLLMARGQLRRAAALCQEFLSGENRETLPALVMAQVGLAQVLHEWNQLEEAETLLTEALEVGRASGLYMGKLFARLVQARIARSRNEMGTALDLLNEPLQLSHQQLPFRAMAEYERARIWLATGRLAELAEWLAAQGVHDAASLSAKTIEQHLLLARLHHQQGNSQAAGAILRDVLRLAETSGQGGYLVKAGLLSVLVATDEEERLGYLRRVLRLGRQQGYIRSFVDEGEPVRELLQGVQGIEVAYVENLLTAFAGQSVGEGVSRDGLIEGLTEQEMRVLRLIQAGLSNREIGAELVITLNTVKTHIKGLYAKLDVHSRTQALLRADELGLL